MDQKNTTKAAKKTAKTDAKPSVATTKPVDTVKTYATFGALLAAKSKKALPYGTKANVSGDKIVFTAKGIDIASVPLRDFANNELKRHGFSIKA